MPKKIMQDIIKKPAARKQETEAPEEMFEFTEPSGGRLGKKILWSVLTLGAIFFGLLLLNCVSSATVNITPRQKFIGIDSSLRAERGSEKSGLSFEIVRLEKEDIGTAQATGVAEEGARASGQIVIYNTYGSKPQILIAQTRFESPDGRIYRIRERVSVPGNGSLEVAVYADEPGPEYNMGFVDFTIPGFKGGPMYDKIYARSKTEMSGGASGISRIITKEDIAAARETVRKNIADYLERNISAQKPEGYIFYENAVNVVFSEIAENPRAGDGAADSPGIFTLKEKGAALGFLLNKDELAKTLAEEYVGEGENKNVKIINLEELDFSLLSVNESNTEMTFRLKGKARFADSIDVDSLIGALADSDGADYESVFSNYPGIENAKVFFRPSWWKAMPTRESRIRVEIIY